MRQFFRKLRDQFADKEYAHAYMESHSLSRLAAQIYALRTQRGWSQEKLAEVSGIAQERISKIESANFDSLTMKTLWKFSRAFDVDVRIAFESFSHGILDVANLNREQLEVKSREEDLRERFRDTTLFLNHNGGWSAVNHLSTVKVFTPNKPLSVSGNDHSWQKIDMQQNEAYG